jgi:hypothetical protein
VSKSIEDQFEDICLRIEKGFMGDVQILVGEDYRNYLHVDVQEIEDPDDEEEGCESGWSTINAGIFDNHKEAIIWLNQHYPEDK